MKHILVTTDFSKESQSAFEYAKAQADLFGKKSSQIHILCILEDFSPHAVSFGFGLATIDTTGILDKAFKSAQERVKSIAEEQFSGYSTSPVVVRGQRVVSQEITKYAEEHGVELIVMATHGRTGVKKFLTGSITEEVLHHAKCPVFVAPADTEYISWRNEANLRRHIVVTTDFSESAKCAYPYAHEQVQLAKGEKPHLTLLHISDNLVRATYGIGLGVDIEQIRRDIETKSWEELNKIRADHFPNDIADSVVIRGDLSDALELVNYGSAHNVDLFIMATHGRSGVGHFLLGSVTEKVIRLSKRPVLVIPSKGR